jgi:Cu2+-containing amine oxidase
MTLHILGIVHLHQFNNRCDQNSDASLSPVTVVHLRKFPTSKKNPPVDGGLT